MRKLIVSNAMSQDGYYEGPGKNVMALFDYRWPTQRTRASMLITPNGCVRLTLLLGRVSLDDRPDCIGRRDAGIRRTASEYPSAHRHTHVAWLRNVLLRYEVRRQET